MAAYRGYVLSCNPNNVTAVNGVLTTAGDIVGAKALELKAQVNELLAYAAADPAVSCSLTGNEIDPAVNLVNEYIDDAKSKLDSTVKAITDYGDGKWDDAANQACIDDLINSIPKGPGKEDGGGIAPTTTNDDVLNPNEDTVTTSEPGTGDSSDLTADEEIIISSVGDDIVEDISVNVADVGDDDLTVSDSGSDDDLGTKAFSNSLAVPSIKTDELVDGIKSSGALGVGVVSAVAAAAIGGKVFYDKKREDEEDDDDSNVLEEEKVNNNRRFIYVDNMVDFKNKLISDGEVNE